MDKSKRVLTFITFFICTACLALLSGSLSTHKWIVVKPIRSINGTFIQVPSIESERNMTRTSRNYDTNEFEKESGIRMSRENEKFRGTIYFGLFHGTKSLNYGFGDRHSAISMKEELLRNPNLMTFGLWLFTVLCVAIAIIFGLVSSIFAIINTVMTPIEVISGIQGLYLWNGMGALFCTGACVSWIVQFKTKLRKNVLSEEEIRDGWSSENRAHLGLSFFLVAAALALFLLNVLLVAIAASRSCRTRKTRPLSDKSPEGVIMLY